MTTTPNDAAIEAARAIVKAWNDAREPYSIVHPIDSRKPSRIRNTFSGLIVHTGTQEGCYQWLDEQSALAVAALPHISAPAAGLSEAQLTEMICSNSCLDYIASKHLARTIIDRLAASPAVTSSDEIARDARRYRRLQILGCAVMDTPQLENGTVVRFAGLDEIIDKDLKVTPSRGEAPPASRRGETAPEKKD